MSVSGVNGATPPSYRLQFRFKSESMPSATAFTSRLFFAYPKVAGVACPVGLTGAATSTQCLYSVAVNHPVTAGDSTGWVLVDRTVTPPANSDGLNFNAIWLEFVGTLPGGKLGLDTVSLANMGTGAELLANGSFSDGHRQTGTGDHAAVFLGRLGGTAFWGSTSHHFTGGHAFERNALETLVYFMRGLPLGEAVWFDDDSETGLFYGDPLYSPLAVRINPPSANKWNFISPQAALPLSGSTINGRGITVDTSYSIHYCAGTDPYLCGTTAKPWISTGIESQPGKFTNQNLGAWDTSTLALGAYTLRLAVTSNSDGKTQTYNDFLTVRMTSQTSDFDGDGLTDRDEIDTHHTDPTRADSDYDGLTDAQEILIIHSNPNARDSDGDGISDGEEDQDGDGYSNSHELRSGGNPVDATSVPLAFVGLPESNLFNVETGIPFSYQFNATWPGAVFKFRNGSFGPVPQGMNLSPSGLLTWTPTHTQVSGAFGDGYYYQMVELSHTNLNNTIPQFVVFGVTPGNTGDINEDGVVDVADIALLQRHLLGISALSTRQSARADLAPNAAPDGVLSMGDLQALTRKVLEE